jgi:hypothetical protein
LCQFQKRSANFSKEEFPQVDLQGAIVHSSSEIDRNPLKGKRGKITLQEECSFRVYPKLSIPSPSKVW